MFGLPQVFRGSGMNQSNEAFSIMKSHICNMATLQQPQHPLHIQALPPPSSWVFFLGGGGFLVGFLFVIKT